MDPNPAFPGADEAPEALRARVTSKVQSASIALLVLGILGIATSILGMVSSFFLPFLEMNELELDELGEVLASPWLNAAFSCVGIGFSAVVTYGATRMKSLQSYGWAMAAAIIALFPCTSPCCCLVGTPIGIWALIVLLDDDVKRAFG